MKDLQCFDWEDLFQGFHLLVVQAAVAGSVDCTCSVTGACSVDASLAGSVDDSIAYSFKPPFKPPSTVSSFRNASTQLGMK